LPILNGSQAVILEVCLYVYRSQAVTCSAPLSHLSRVCSASPILLAHLRVFGCCCKWYKFRVQEKLRRTRFFPLRLPQPYANKGAGGGSRLLHRCIRPWHSISCVCMAKYDVTRADLFSGEKRGSFFERKKLPKP